MHHSEFAPAESPTLKYQKQKRSESNSNTTKIPKTKSGPRPTEPAPVPSLALNACTAFEAMKPEVNRFAQAQSLLQQADGYSDAIHDKS